MADIRNSSKYVETFSWGEETLLLHWSNEETCNLPDDEVEIKSEKPIFARFTVSTCSGSKRGRQIAVKQQCPNVMQTSFSRHIGFPYG